MRYTTGVVLASLVMGSAMGCGEDQCAAGCLWAHVNVRLDPPVPSSYDVDLVLDGVSGAFSCERPDLSGWTAMNKTGSGQTVAWCDGESFWIQATPESVEISVTAQDGSWIGSVKESPEYETGFMVCGELCPPSAVVTVEQQ